MTIPKISFVLLAKSLSHNRLAAYSLPSDQDSADAIARYLWNLALCAAMHPVLHTLEVAFRNALFDVGTEVTIKRAFATRI